MYWINWWMHEQKVEEVSGFQSDTALEIHPPFLYMSTTWEYKRQFLPMLLLSLGCQDSVLSACNQITAYIACPFIFFLLLSPSLKLFPWGNVSRSSRFHENFCHMHSYILRLIGVFTIIYTILWNSSFNTCLHFYTVCFIMIRPM